MTAERRASPSRDEPPSAERGQVKKRLGQEDVREQRSDQRRRHHHRLGELRRLCRGIIAFIGLQHDGFPSKQRPDPKEKVAPPGGAEP